LKLPVSAGSGGGLRLGDLVEVSSYLEPGYLNRYNSNRAVTLTANLKSDTRLSVPAVVQIVKAYYQTIAAKYPGAEVDFAGEFESTKRSYTSLAYAFIIALLAIYMILALQFQSYLQPFIILSAVGFALIGVVFGKFLTQGLFTVNSFIAVIGVTGVVVNDSLVLIDFINRAYLRLGDRRAAIREGIRIRLRPILLTTLTTTLGLLPMAIGFPYYSLVWGTMASTLTQCHQLFVTQRLFPCVGKQVVPLPEGVGHSYNKPGDECGAQDKTKPHAEYMLCEVVVVLYVITACEGNEKEQQQGVAAGSEQGHRPGSPGRKYGCRDDQRDKKEPRKGIGGATGEVQDSGQRHYVDRQLDKKFPVLNAGRAEDSSPGPEIYRTQEADDE
jgi:hypothetical protein